MNKTLLAGLLLTAIMVAASLFGKVIAPHDLKDRAHIGYVVDKNGKGALIAPPISPSLSLGYPLGTDRYGYDLMAKILDGAKYTLFLSVSVAFTRVFLGGMLGMLLGYFAKKPAKRRPGISFWKILNGIPVFLVAWLLLAGISINPSLSPLYLSILMGVVLTLIGIPSVAFTIKDKTYVIRQNAFILASQSVGSGHGRIIRSHIFPHLKESFLISIVQEVILTLTVFGQLAIFHLFVGGTIMTPDPVEYNSSTNEWAGLIAQARDNLTVDKWILFMPLAAYFLLIMGFQLVSKGLETMYNNKHTKPSQL